MENPQLTHDDLIRGQFSPRAEAYAESPVHASGEDLDWIEAIAAKRMPARALDLGCGGGHVAYRLARHSAEVTACDLSEAMAASVANTAALHGLSHVRTAVASAENLPFSDEQFDLVVSRLSAHHWRDLEVGLREMRRVLADGGTGIIVDTIAPADPVSDVHLQSIELLRDPSHVRSYRVCEWLGVLGRAGFHPRSLNTHRVRMEFQGWIDRMKTPPDHVAAIRSLQRCVSSGVANRLLLEADGSFMIDVMAIEVT